MTMNLQERVYIVNMLDKSHAMRLKKGCWGSSIKKCHKDLDLGKLLNTLKGMDLCMTIRDLAAKEDLSGEKWICLKIIWSGMTLIHWEHITQITHHGLLNFTFPFTFFTERTPSMITPLFTTNLNESIKNYPQIRMFL